MKSTHRHGTPTRREARLIFRAPAAQLSAAELLGRAVPEALREVQVDAFREGAVEVAGRTHRDASGPVAPGAQVSVTGALSEQLGLPAALEHAPTARALVPALPWSRGELGEAGERFRFEQTVRRGALAEVRLVDVEGEPLVLEGVLGALARLGHAVIGDAWHGGILASGGLRVLREEAADPLDWWPREPLLLGTGPQSGGKGTAFAISSESEQVLRRGHPWVLADEESADPHSFRPGALVRFESARGRAVGLGVVDGEGRCVARRWSRGTGRSSGVERRVEEAFERRSSLLESRETDAFRLVHGEADALPGLVVDRLGSVLRVLISGRSALSFAEAARDAAVRALRARTGVEPSVVEVMHLRRPRGTRLECARLVVGQPEALGLDDAGRFVVRERGLRFAVDPGLADPWRSAPGVGLFFDQRANRARVAECVAAAPSGRWLNLFAHTGAFSVALLAAGAREVVSVDLSGRVLAWLDHNLALNREQGVDPARHVGVRRDGRRFLDALPAGERFDGVILDPPTAAAAGRRYWSIRKDLQPMVEKALEHLEPGGWLLAARNDRAGRKGSLSEAFDAASRRAGVRLSSVEPANPGADFPHEASFPEGQPFRALLARRSQQ